jgi:hypothetical protein
VCLPHSLHRVGLDSRTQLTNTPCECEEAKTHHGILYQIWPPSADEGGALTLPSVVVCRAVGLLDPEPFVSLVCFRRLQRLELSLLCAYPFIVLTVLTAQTELTELPVVFYSRSLKTSAARLAFSLDVCNLNRGSRIGKMSPIGFGDGQKSCRCKRSECSVIADSERERAETGVGKTTAKYESDVLPALVATRQERNCCRCGGLKFSRFRVSFFRPVRQLT